VNALYDTGYGSRISCLNLTFLHEWCVHNRLFNGYYEVKFKKTPDTRCVHLTMEHIEDLGSDILVKVQDTKNYKSRPFTILGKFYLKFAKHTWNNLDLVVDFTNIIETSSINNITKREVGISGALKFENCK
jgi:hypothetical protein